MAIFTAVSKFVVGAINPAHNTASAALQQFRLARCLAPCIHLKKAIEGSKICNLCKCPVESKATVKSERCPDKQW